MRSRALFLAALLFLMGCNGGSNTTETGNPTASGTLPSPGVTTVAAPDPDTAARSYLDSWVEGDYSTMYNLLTTLSRDSIRIEDFEARYRHVATEANLYEIEYEITQSLVNTPQSAQVGYRVTLRSAIVGEITRETTMALSREGDEWRVAWDDTLILPELAGGNTLSMERVEPARGNIYDNDGDILATSTEAYALTVIPSGVSEGQRDGLVRVLSDATGLTVSTLAARIFDEEAAFFVAVGEISSETFNNFQDRFLGFGNALRWEPYNTRFYPSEGIAPQTVGYFGTIPAEELEIYIPLGYQVDDRVGRMGIERWGESYLAGTIGGDLYVISPENTIVTKLAGKESQASQSIYTTLDKDLQLGAQEAIKDFAGAIVVMERDTGRILAMASSPGFNPNAADPANYNSQLEWDGYFSDPDAPFINHGVQFSYPPGSIFKVVTLAAALESGVYTPEYSFYCGHTWEEIPGVILNDWTLEKELPPTGQIDLIEGLMRSCNPLFYDIGLTLYNQGFTTAVADMARGFGLGVESGIEQFFEEAGQVTDPADDPSTGQSAAFAAVQQAFGQGTTLLTPLQAATYIAAVGNGGNLLLPQIIQRIESPDGGESLAFSPVINGTLPISPENLAQIQRGLRMVVNDPRGTAYRRFSGFPIQTAGKTGTASVSEVGVDPHSWFIGYTFNENPNLPDIAIAVIVENIGEGSDYAAPIFRRVAEIYFYGRPLTLFPWESDFGVMETETPTPEATEEGDGGGSGGTGFVTPTP